MSDWKGGFTGAFNIREDDRLRRAAVHRAHQNRAENRTCPAWISICPEQKGRACPSRLRHHSDVDDLVYNDFYIGEGADVTIVAGCGVHTDTRRGGAAQRHPPVLPGGGRPGEVHRKSTWAPARTGIRSIDPVTECHLQAGAVLEMDTSQIGGVDRTTRKTKATLGEKAKLVIRERLLTEGAAAGLHGL